LRGCGAQQEEPGPVLRPVDQHAEHFEQLGQALRLVEDHEVRQTLQRSHGSGQPANVDRVLEVEELRRHLLRDHPGERGLAALPWTEQGRNGMHAQSCDDALQSSGARDHRGIIP
jgi:hypothetical protein